MTRARSLAPTMILVSLSCAGPPTEVPLEPNETVIGRAHDADRVQLLTSRRRILTIDLTDLSMVSRDVTGLVNDPWGLAVSSDGRLWTLDGTSHLAHVDDEGRVGERRSLGKGVVGLFSLGGAVFVQPTTFVPGEAALRRLDLDTMTLSDVGSLRSTAFETRAELLTRNLVGCGSSRGGELPCWFSQGSLVDRISEEGGRRQTLGELGLGSPRDGSIDSPGPIVDAHVDITDALWVLVRRPRQTGGEEYVLGRYQSDGDMVNARVVSNRPRLILGAQGSDCVLLIGAGQISTVTVS